MSENHHLPYTNTTTDSPLDLTVKRPDMDINDSNEYLQKSFTATIATLNNPMAEYSAYQQNSSSGYYESEDQYSPMYDTASNGFVPTLDPSQAQNLAIPTSYSAPSSPVNEGNIKGFQNNPMESSVLPKKRKNLWRPYDRSALDAQFDEREFDSGSDSSSNSSSDQEFKTPQAPVDPMKRRKRNMLKYAEENLDDQQKKMNIKQSNLHSSQMKPSPNEGFGDANKQMSGDVIETMAPSSGVPGDVKEQVISGMKKRDIFGWSLKLAKPTEEEKSTANGEVPSVCQDGYKTYFELQTVKKNGSSEEPMVVGDTETPVSPDKSTRSPLKQQNSKQTAGNRRANVNRKQMKELEKENCKNIQNNRVYIQRRDNVIESFDETQNVPLKRDTEKKLSLIDLIEEIEADARKQDKEEAEKTQKRNMGIVKLLEQCNHVKLQALDYLMSNVLIEEGAPTFKNKNETVQKMLNGDKIGTVNMLDIVELQVEMGLN